MKLSTEPAAIPVIDSCLAACAQEMRDGWAVSDSRRVEAAAARMDELLDLRNEARDVTS